MSYKIYERLKIGDKNGRNNNKKAYVYREGFVEVVGSFGD